MSKRVAVKCDARAVHVLLVVAGWWWQAEQERTVSRCASVRRLDAGMSMACSKDSSPHLNPCPASESASSFSLFHLSTSPPSPPDTVTTGRTGSDTVPSEPVLHSSRPVLSLLRLRQSSSTYVVHPLQLVPGTRENSFSSPHMCLLCFRCVASAEPGVGRARFCQTKDRESE